MANIKISELGAGQALAETDLIAVVQDISAELTTTKQTLENVLTFIKSSLFVNSGQIKLNGYTIAGTKPTWTNPTTITQITYGNIGTMEHLVFSGSPTSTPPPNIPNDYNDIYSAFYDYTTGYFLENQLLGQQHLFRLVFSYTKNVGSNPIVEITISNPNSSFTQKQVFTLPDSSTAGNFTALFFTIADQASLPAPLGTGGGYKLEIQNLNSIGSAIYTLEHITTFYLGYQEFYKT